MLAHDKRPENKRPGAAKLISVSELGLCEDAARWDGFVSQAADGSVLQSFGWGQLKSRYGWTVSRYFWLDGGREVAAISVLRRRLPGGLALDYAPRGPVLNGSPDRWPEFWKDLRRRLVQPGGTVLKVDPLWVSEEEARLLRSQGARPSRRPIQHQASWLVDISGGEAAFSRLKESTRRNIRQGERRGVVVDASDGTAAMDSFYDLLVATGNRRNFVVRPREYYQDLLQLFRVRGQVSVYLARLDQRVLAGAVMLFFGPTLVYLFGGTSAGAEDLKPGYLLHWRAIEEAQRRGCVSYDMFGVPLDPRPGHPGYGYYTFKSRFNGRQVRYIGLYDLPVSAVRAAAVRLAERFYRAGAPEFV